MKRKTVCVITAIGCCFLLCGPVQAQTIWQTMQRGLDAMVSDAAVTVSTIPAAGWLDNPKYYYEFAPTGATPSQAMIIYPGAYVPAEAYAPAAHDIAAAGYLAVVVPMPLYLTIADNDNRAATVISDHPGITRWTIGGHSLGGVTACDVAASIPAIEGVVFWASYPSDDKSGFGKRVISIYGTDDGISTPAEIALSEPNLPPDTLWVPIKGANHTQFGWYDNGTQPFVQPVPAPGDNPSTLTHEEQHASVVQATLDFLGSYSAAIPAALETVTGDDGSTWERVSVPGFGNPDNVAVVALTPYRDSLYALTRNDVSGFEIWQTAGTGWVQVNVPGFTDINDYFGWVKPGPYGLSDFYDSIYNLRQNIWGDMIVFKDKLYVTVESGYQGAFLFGSLGLQIWRFDGTAWEAVVAPAADEAGTITDIADCTAAACAAGNTIDVECSSNAGGATQTTIEALPDADCDGIAEGTCSSGSCVDPALCGDVICTVEVACSSGGGQATQTTAEILPDADCDGIAEGDCSSGSCVDPALCGDSLGAYTANFSDSTASWGDLSGCTLRVEAVFDGSQGTVAGTPGMRVFEIVSNTATTLTVQQNELAQTDEFTVCDETLILGDVGRASYVIPKVSIGDVYTIDCQATRDSLANIWNKSIVDFETLNGELFATIGLNYEDGTRIWKTSDGTTWVPVSDYSFGLFQGFEPDGTPIPDADCPLTGLSGRNGQPVSSSSTSFGKSDVTGTMTLFTGATGTSGCNGRGARALRYDEPDWNFIVDYFVDNNTVGTNENGFGWDGGSQGFFVSNFQAWKWTEYDDRIFTGIVRLEGGARVMSSGSGSTADDAWIYSVGGNASLPGSGFATLSDGFGSTNTIGSNLYTLHGAPSHNALLLSGNFGNPDTGAEIWKGSGPGDSVNWARITGNAFGDANIVEWGTFTTFDGTLYAAASSYLASTIPGDNGTGLSGAKIYRMVSDGGCGNGLVDPGEQCGEPGLSCDAGQFCNTCVCEVGCAPDNTITVDCAATPEAATHTEALPDADCDGIAEGDCLTGTCADPGQCGDVIGPVLIELSDFTAQPLNRAIRLVWATESEIDSAGFNIYRASSKRGPYVQINDDLIPSEGSAATGADYEYVDNRVKNRKQYWYKLEDVDFNGTSTMHGPISARPRLIFTNRGLQ